MTKPLSEAEHRFASAARSRVSILIAIFIISVIATSVSGYILSTIEDLNPDIVFSDPRSQVWSFLILFGTIGIFGSVLLMTGIFPHREVAKYTLILGTESPDVTPDGMDDVITAIRDIAERLMMKAPRPVIADLEELGWPHIRAKFLVGMVHRLQNSFEFSSTGPKIFTQLQKNWRDLYVQVGWDEKYANRVIEVVGEVHMEMRSHRKSPVAFVRFLKVLVFVLPLLYIVLRIISCAENN
ncbi:MAG TPA: hypothetical protein VGB30_05285 [bacterium]|jgi:hypothetical protein